MTIGLWGLCASMVLGGLGCGGGCGGGGLPSGDLDGVPAEARAVFVLDLASYAEEVRGYTPFSRFEGRWDDLAEDLDAVLSQRTGVGLHEAESLVGWFVDDETWAFRLDGDFEGQLPGDGPEVGGHRAVELGDEARLVLIDDDRVLVGSQTGLTRMLAVLDDPSESVSESDDEQAETLVDLLESVGGSQLAVAATAGDFAEALGPMAPAADGVAMSTTREQITVLARLADSDEADSAASQLRALLAGAVVEVSERADDAREDPDADLEEALGSIVVEHVVRLFKDELLTIDSSGADVVLEVDISDMGGGVGLLGVAAAVAVPQFLEYLRRAQTSEARVTLQQIRARTEQYYAEFGQLPDSAPRTPANVPCDETTTPADAWAQPTWQALSFSMTDAHRFSYQFDREGEGDWASFTASAFGDLDCDGVYSTFTLDGWLSGGELHGGSYVMDENEME